MSDVIPRGRVGTPNHPDGTGGSSCAGCGAPLVPDQRYCLSCGRPCSPVRLAFLDVLQGEYQPAGVGGSNSVAGGAGGAAIYAAPPEPDNVLGSLRRYSGLFGLLGVLLAALLIGLLVGHWLTGGASSGKQVLEVKGLSGVLAAAPAASSAVAGGAVGTSTGSGSGSDSGSGSKSSAPASATKAHTTSKSEEKAEEAEAAKEVAEPKPLPAAHKASSTLEKLAHSTGKKHAEEENRLGTAPIETGH